MIVIAKATQWNNHKNLLARYWCRDTMKMNSVRGRLGKTAAFSLNKCRHHKHIEVEVEVVVENQLGCIVLPLLSGRSRRMLMATVDLPCMNMTGNMTVILLASHQTLSGNGIHWYEPIISPDISHQNWFNSTTTELYFGLNPINVNWIPKRLIWPVIWIYWNII